MLRLSYPKEEIIHASKRDGPTPIQALREMVPPKLFSRERT